MVKLSPATLESSLMLSLTLAVVYELVACSAERTDLRYLYPLILLCLALVAGSIPNRPPSSFPYSRPHPAPSSSFVLSALLLPALFASQTLYTHAWAGDDCARVLFYLASCCSLLAHASLLWVPSLSLWTFPLSPVFVLAATLLPALVEAFDWFPNQALLTFATLAAFIALISILPRYAPHSFTPAELILVSTLAALMAGHLLVHSVVTLLAVHHVQAVDTARMAAAMPFSPALLLGELAVAAGFGLALLPPSLVTVEKGGELRLAWQRVLGYGGVLLCVVVYPLLLVLLGEEPLSFVTKFLSADQWSHGRTLVLARLRFVTFVVDRPRLLLLLYWALVLAVSLPLSPSPQSRRFGVQLPLVVVRKYYHALAVLLFLPAVCVDCAFTAFSIAVAFFVLLLAEWLRIHRVQPFARFLSAFTARYLDSRDSGTVILTPLYLLAGCALPCAAHAYVAGAPLGPALAGVYVLGVGDAMASVAGVYRGRTSWAWVLGMGGGVGGRSVEGTVGGVLSILALHGLVCARLTGLERGGWPAVVHWTVATVACGLMEAFTSQIDNLTLPLFYYTAWNVAIADPRMAYTVVRSATTQ